MSTYAVTAYRWKRYWVLDVQGVGVTQTRHLRDADQTVREYIALTTGRGEYDFDLDIVKADPRRLNVLRLG